MSSPLDAAAPNALHQPFQPFHYPHHNPHHHRHNTHHQLQHTQFFTPTPTPTPPPQQPMSTSRPKPGRALRDKEVSEVLTMTPHTEEVNYPCHWPSVHAEKLTGHQMTPEDPRLWTKRIPYKGAKEGFLRKTGRARFDIHGYKFHAHSTEGIWTPYYIIWDYYNGLVRVHDLFTCCKPGKTEPGNAVKEKVNPGLADICHNITGGNLTAQGYWIPWDCAKALAAKFCYRIRYILAIVFGDDFPDLCLPESHPDFGRYDINPAIIEYSSTLAAQQLATETLRNAGMRYATPAPTANPTPEMQPQARILNNGAMYDAIRDRHVSRYTGSNSEFSRESTAAYERKVTPGPAYANGYQYSPAPSVRSELSYLHPKTPGQSYVLPPNTPPTTIPRGRTYTSEYTIRGQEYTSRRRSRSPGREILSPHQQPLPSLVNEIPFGGEYYTPYAPRQQQQEVDCSSAFERPLDHYLVLNNPYSPSLRYAQLSQVAPISQPAQTQMEQSVTEETSEPGWPGRMAAAHLLVSLKRQDDELREERETRERRKVEIQLQYAQKRREAEIQQHYAGERRESEIQECSARDRREAEIHERYSGCHPEPETQQEREGRERSIYRQRGRSV